jgi:hypothetical protein
MHGRAQRKAFIFDDYRSVSEELAIAGGRSDYFARRRFTP